MPIASHFTSVFEQNWKINFTQCTPNGNLKYTDLCNLLQITAASHSEIGGISFKDMQLFHQAWVLSRMRVELIFLPRWNDTITIRTWINSMENSRSVRALEVYVNGVKCVGVVTFWAVFNTQTRRPETLALPHDHFKLYPNLKATKNSFSKIELQNNAIKIAEKTVFLSDLDLVNHVNNVKYLEWCLDFVDETLVLDQQIESFEMNFMKELSLKDIVEIENSVLENKSVFSIKKDAKSVFALEVNWKKKSFKNEAFDL